MRRLLAFVALACVASSSQAITIDWVTVGDPGNTADTSGQPNPAGAVADTFEIMKYEFTNQQYVEFLNAVDPEGTNPDSIFNTTMGTGSRGGITNTGSTNGSRYAAKTNMGDKPVNYVSWWDAARVANWLQAGGLTYGTTASGSAAINVGAYTLSSGTSGIAPAKNGGAQYYIPTEDQWYKAAYYKGSSTNAGYWDYATQSDTLPTSVTANGSGVGSAGNTGNFANYRNDADWNTLNGMVTTVGTNGGPSAYGAFDMSGNIGEWNDLTGAADVNRGLRGGNYETGAAGLQLSSTSTVATDASGESSLRGFRLASAPVPEIDPAGLGSVLALVTGAIGLLERRRSRR